MKKTTTILGLMAFGLATATAGVAPRPFRQRRRYAPSC